MAEQFPRIVRFFETQDAPGSACPHCGAEGRWIFTFQVEDGRRLGAMRGCVKLFPVSRIATEELRLAEKLRKYKKSYGQNATLNRADTEAWEAIQAFYEGVGSERSALAYVDAAKSWNTRKYRKR